MIAAASPLSTSRVGDVGGRLEPPSQVLPLCSLCSALTYCCCNSNAQVLFNMAPVSYTASCTATTTAAIQSSVIPPGVTLPAGSTIPPLVSPGTLSVACHPRLQRPMSSMRRPFELQH